MTNLQRVFKGLQMFYSLPLNCVHTLRAAYICCLPHNLFKERCRLFDHQSLHCSPFTLLCYACLLCLYQYMLSCFYPSFLLPGSLCFFLQSFNSIHTIKHHSTFDKQEIQVSELLYNWLWKNFPTIWKKRLKTSFKYILH